MGTHGIGRGGRAGVRLRQPSSRTGTLTLISDATGAEHIVKVTGPVAGAHAELGLSGSAATIRAPGGGRMDIQLGVEGKGSAWQTYDAGELRLGAGQTLRLTPVWSRLTSAGVVASLSGRHGNRHLHNHLFAPAASVRAASVSASGHGASLAVKLATPLLKEGASVLVNVTVSRHGRVLARGHAAVAIGPARGATLAIAVAGPVQAGARARFVVRTEVGGTSPSTATIKRTLALGR